MPRALLSVSDKTGIVEFARGLHARGFELVSTGGTALTLERAGLPVLSVSTVTGFPEMLDGRVKTLDPHIHGGILARRSRPDDLEAISRHDIALIDLVVVNLYPFVKAAQNPDTPFEDLIEEIDIGGPSLVRAAAKNFVDVIVVVSPADYVGVLDALDRPGGPSRRFRFDLARKAFAHTARYDTAIASTLSAVIADDDGFTRRRPARFQTAWRSICARFAISATARTRISAARSTPGSVLIPVTRCSRARSCRTRTCSIWMRPFGW